MALPDHTMIYYASHSNGPSSEAIFTRMQFFFLIQNNKQIDWLCHEKYMKGKGSMKENLTSCRSRKFWFNLVHIIGK